MSGKVRREAVVMASQQDLRISWTVGLLVYGSKRHRNLWRLPIIFLQGSPYALWSLHFFKFLMTDIFSVSSDLAQVSICFFFFFLHFQTKKTLLKKARDVWLMSLDIIWRAGWLNRSLLGRLLNRGLFLLVSGKLLNRSTGLNLSNNFNRSTCLSNYVEGVDSGRGGGILTEFTLGSTNCGVDVSLFVTCNLG